MPTRLGLSLPCLYLTCLLFDLGRLLQAGHSARKVTAAATTTEWGFPARNLTGPAILLASPVTTAEPFRRPPDGTAPPPRPPLKGGHLRSPSSQQLGGAVGRRNSKARLKQIGAPSVSDPTSLVDAHRPPESAAAAAPPPEKRFQPEFAQVHSGHRELDPLHRLKRFQEDGDSVGETRPSPVATNGGRTKDRDRLQDGQLVATAPGRKSAVVVQTKVQHEGSARPRQQQHRTSSDILHNTASDSSRIRLSDIGVSGGDHREGSRHDPPSSASIADKRRFDDSDNPTDYKVSLSRFVSESKGEVVVEGHIVPGTDGNLRKVGPLGDPEKERQVRHLSPDDDSPPQPASSSRGARPHGTARPLPVADQSPKHLGSGPQVAAVRRLANADVAIPLVERRRGAIGGWQDRPRAGIPAEPMLATNAQTTATKLESDPPLVPHDRGPYRSLESRSISDSGKVAQATGGRLVKEDDLKDDRSGSSASNSATSRVSISDINTSENVGGNNDGLFLGSGSGRNQRTQPMVSSQDGAAVSSGRSAQPHPYLNVSSATTFTQQCLHSQFDDSNQRGCNTSWAEEHAAHICSLNSTSQRLTALLHHPDHPSVCWAHPDTANDDIRMSSSSSSSGLDDDDDPGGCFDRPSRLPPPVLKPSQIDRLRADGNRAASECRQAALEVFCAIQTANEVIERILRVVESGFCVGLGGLTSDPDDDGAGRELDDAGGVCSPEQLDDEDGSAQPEDQDLDEDLLEEQLNMIQKCRYCQKCKDWLKTWLCMVQWPLYLAPEDPERGPVKVQPCPAVCSVVQEHCPFNIIMEDASMAGGDPAFLCQDPVILESNNYWTRPQCCSQPINMEASPESGLKKDGARGVPSPEEKTAPVIIDPPAGGYIDLNATGCSAARLFRPGFPRRHHHRQQQHVNCDRGVGGNRLWLANKPLGLRPLPPPTILPSNWLWDLIRRASTWISLDGGDGATTTAASDEGHTPAAAGSDAVAALAGRPFIGRPGGEPAATRLFFLLLMIMLVLVLS